MKRRQYLGLVLGTIVATSAVMCDCDFLFKYRGLVVDDSTGLPVGNAEVRTTDYVLFEVDSDTIYSDWWVDTARTDTTGRYHLRVWGLYYCGGCRGHITEPDDLGGVRIWISSPEHLELDTIFAQDDLRYVGCNSWEIPELRLQPLPPADTLDER